MKNMKKRPYASDYIVYRTKQTTVGWLFCVCSNGKPKKYGIIDTVFVEPKCVCVRVHVRYKRGTK